MKPSPHFLVGVALLLGESLNGFEGKTVLRNIQTKSGNRITAGVAVVVSGQGCGFRSSRALQIETPVFLSDLPGGGSVTARVASCLPLGRDGKYFLIGVALYTHGNVWGIVDPPEDWGTTIQAAAAAGAASAGQPVAPKAAASGKNWPYNRFESGTDVRHKGR